MPFGCNTSSMLPSLLLFLLPLTCLLGAVIVVAALEVFVAAAAIAAAAIAVVWVVVDVFAVLVCCFCHGFGALLSSPRR